MAEQLELRVADLQHSRDLLSDNIRRLGDALQRTHDLDGLLATVAAISASTTESVRATVWLLEGDSLMARVAWPVESARGGPRRVSRVDTLPGLVSGDGVPRRIDGGDAAARLGGPALGSPLQRGATVLGAVVVERSPGSAPYTDEDSAILLSITGPAGIAMDNALLHRQAQRSAVTDPLTGVGNLRMLTTTLAREVDRARLFQRDVALLILDIDHFRELNDVHGHAAGDAILAAVAARVVGSVRAVDRVARYGGEEFAVVCPELDPADAHALALRVWGAVRDEPFDVGGTPVEVRVSVGVASWPRQAATSAELLRAADAAVSRAKGSGRDQVRAAPDSSG
jgi:diguanylate cyclase (GGDEF)-like protein